MCLGLPVTGGCDHAWVHSLVGHAIRIDVEIGAILIGGCGQKIRARAVAISGGVGGIYKVAVWRQFILGKCEAFCSTNLGKTVTG